MSGREVGREVGRSAESDAVALDPTYRDIEVCACPTPGWTHHTGFHSFVTDRERRAVKAALARVERDQMKWLRSMGAPPGARAILTDFIRAAEIRRVTRPGQPTTGAGS